MSSFFFCRRVVFLIQEQLFFSQEYITYPMSTSFSSQEGIAHLRVVVGQPRVEFRTKEQLVSPKSRFTFPRVVFFHPIVVVFLPRIDYLAYEYIFLILRKKCSPKSSCWTTKSRIPYQKVVAFHPRVYLLSQKLFLFLPIVEFINLGVVVFIQEQITCPKSTSFSSY